ncbi:unnamed protein product [Blepharisma stoltei]|uniref:Uncharacterized protein n=1 Tax=Blepharisma stoltei TaxID=1481888 RepID=A0AAU9IAP4_9CILI|nr:unnamed protein product [Blepharisma stoltei]
MWLKSFVFRLNRNFSQKYYIRPKTILDWSNINSPQDAIKLAKAKNAPVSQIAQSLRVISDKVKWDNLSAEDKKEFTSLSEKIQDSIANLTPQGVVDYCYWLNRTNAALPMESIMRLDTKVTEFVLEDALSLEQVCYLYNSLHSHGYYIYELEEYVTKIIEDFSTKLNPKEISLLIKGLKYKMTEKSKNLIDICNKRLENLDLEDFDDESLVNFVSSLEISIEKSKADKLKQQLELTNFSPIQIFQIAKKLVPLKVIGSGQVINMTNLLSLKKFMKITIKDLESLAPNQLFDILYSISSTDYPQSIQSLFDEILEMLDKNFSKEGYVVRFLKGNEINLYPTLMKHFKSIQGKIYEYLERPKAKEGGINRVIWSMIFYDADPKVWNNFFNKYLSDFTPSEIENAIKCCRCPFKPLSILLSNLENLNPKLVEYYAIYLAQADFTINDLNDYLSILNRLDPAEFSKSPESYLPFQIFWMILEKSNLSLISDLLTRVGSSLEKLSNAALLSESSQKVGILLAHANCITPSLADRFATILNPNDFSVMRAPLIIGLRTSKFFDKESYLTKIFERDIPFNSFATTLEKYWQWPEDYDSIAINAALERISKIQITDIYLLISMITHLSKLDNTKHQQLLSSIYAASEKPIEKYLSKLRMNDMINFANLSKIPSCYDILPLIRKNLENCPLYTTKYRDAFISKLAETGISDEKIMMTFCNKKQKISERYTYEVVTSMADLRFETEKWAQEYAEQMIDIVEKELIAFDDEYRTINWIYALIRLKKPLESMLRFAENYGVLKTNDIFFKKILLASYYNKDKIFKLSNASNEFDYFEHFGLQRPLMDFYKSLLEKHKIKYRESEFVNNVWVPFYIPSSEIAIWPVSKSVTLYRDKKLKGEFEMHKENIRKVNIKPILVPQSFNSTLDRQNIIGYLEQNGLNIIKGS